MGKYCKDTVINEILIELRRSLSKPNEIFLSEADFQFSFAKALSTCYNEDKVILEYPIPNADLYCQNKKCKSDRSFIDLNFTHKKDEYFIEFKYKLNPLIDKNKNYVNIPRYNHEFNLKLQGASNNGRYLIYEDIERMEKIRQKGENYKSFVIFMTNDSSYWQINQSETCQCFNYPLADSKEIKKRYEKFKRSCTKCKKEFKNCKYADLDIEYNYTINWNNFKIIHCDKNNKFRILVIDLQEIKPFQNV